ncbi:hypothetical protein [Solilutibacter oculi]|uniref:hypothetical protein n=1 Tax=Solilutibacter oculi TaxID=2698682 RepID=UPI001F38B8B6|nr:hypothetical protein [Lysobacter oculi]
MSYPVTMPRTALRLLLAFCLILNGIGNAMAAVAMPAMLDAPAHVAMSMAEASPQLASACDHATDKRSKSLGTGRAPPIGNPAPCRL